MAQMQRAGEICESCKGRWNSKGKHPKTLKRANVTTANKNIVVALCDYCDGPTLENSIKNHRDAA